MSLSGPGVRPTRAGWSLLALAVVLVLMAINEANNLLYALAFVLLSVWLVGAVQAWFNLSGLTLRAVDAPPVCAGETGPLTVQLESGGRVRRNLDLHLAATPSSAHVDEVASPARRIDLPWKAERRGWQQLTAVQVSCRYPLGLAVARRSLSVSVRRLVWPQPAPVDPAPSDPMAANNKEAADGFTGLSPWRAGDSPRRLAWKAMARAGSPMVKRFDGLEGRSATRIDWHDTEGDVEWRLSVLARRVLDAEQRLAPWQLTMPGVPALPLGPGPVALHQALAKLALHGQDGPQEQDR